MSKTMLMTAIALAVLATATIPLIGAFASTTAVASAFDDPPWTLTFHLTSVGTTPPHVVEATVEENQPGYLWWSGYIEIDGVQTYSEAFNYVHVGPGRIMAPSSYNPSLLNAQGTNWRALPDGSWPVTYASNLGILTGTIEVSGHRFDLAPL